MPDLLTDQVPTGTAVPQGKDAFIRLGRAFTLAGMFLLPAMRFRFGHAFALSDSLFAIGIGFLVFSASPLRAPRASGWYLGALLMVIGGITASFAAISPYGSLQVAGNAVFALMAWPWLLRNTLTNSRWRVQAMTAFIGGSTISSLVAIIQVKFHTLGYLPATHGNITEAQRAVGLTANVPDLLGAMDAVAIVMVLGLMLFSGSGRFRWRLVALIVMGVAIILTASVSGMICTLFGCLVLLLRGRVRVRTVIAVAVAVFVVYTVGTGLLAKGSGENLNPISRLEQTLSPGSGYGTVSVRQSTWESAWQGIVQSPVWGHGLDAASGAVYYDPYVGVAYPTHNLILITWYQGGILWLFGAAIAVMAAFRRVIGSARRDPLRNIVFSSMAVVLLFSMQAPELVDRWFWMPMVLALTFGRRPTVPEDLEAARIGARVRRQALARSASSAPVLIQQSGQGGHVHLDVGDESYVSPQ